MPCPLNAKNPLDKVSGWKTCQRSEAHYFCASILPDQSGAQEFTWDTEEASNQATEIGFKAMHRTRDPATDPGGVFSTRYLDEHNLSGGL